MARLKLSPSGLRSPLDLSTEATRPAPGLPPRIVPPTELDDLGPETPTDPVDAPVADGPDADAPAPEAVPTPTAVAVPTVTGGAAASVDTSDLPAWAVGLDVVALAPARLLGRPKQTALILDRDLSSRADALVAATGPRVTFAAVVTAILHFHLPADGEAAARTIGGYRRRKLEALEHPWEERNARLPEPLRAELDDVVAGATGRVASVHRSTLVNALLDAHLPATPDDASRLVTRMEMVRGGAFLDHVG